MDTRKFHPRVDCCVRFFREGWHPFPSGPLNAMCGLCGRSWRKASFLWSSWFRVSREYEGRKKKQDKHAASSTTPEKPQTPAVRTFFGCTVSGSNPERKRASGVSVPASDDDCEVSRGVMAKILASRMTSFAFVARIGALPLPSPSAAGKPTTPFRRRYPAQKLRRIKQRRSRSPESAFCSAAGRSQHRIRLDVGPCRRPDFCCLRGAAPHPVLS